MAYRIKPDRPLESEVRRIATKQLTSALLCLGEGNRPHGEQVIHVGRRHVKKVRALRRLVRPVLEDGRRVPRGRLRTVNRLLAPVCDAEALPATLDRVRNWSLDLDSGGSTAATTRLAYLLVRRRGRVDTLPLRTDVVQACASLLREELNSLPGWRLPRRGRASLHRGLKRTIRKARDEMKRCVAHPSTRAYRRWRERVKDHWLQLRLLRPASQQPTVDELRVARLDELLGELHNAVLLQDVVRREFRMDRVTRAELIRLLRRYAVGLRRAAQVLGTEVYGRPPRVAADEAYSAWAEAGPRRREAEPAPAPAVPGPEDPVPVADRP